MVKDIVKKTGRASYITYILACVIILSAIVIPVYGVITLVDDVNNGKDIFKFDSYC
eukprot:CAMPEP_0168325864 /NCGR_PEP_ID=MMETSP0213-20121227/4947_1 /TAXON_ID=151035 /ORGANISM="Euplotes harpa, Strain FSP1.4" /LENGTH=55 /DNA_ID=CAMNT_0008328441 /DNA_START=1310 /DNA_END=1477 /DNA_ORIENTATION=-